MLVTVRVLPSAESAYVPRYTIFPPSLLVSSNYRASIRRIASVKPGGTVGPERT